MRKLHALLALTLSGASSAALSQTTLPLNTGFDHSTFSVITSPGVQDKYWIKVAASNAPLGVPAFVINKHLAWQNPLSGGGFGSSWISSTAPNGTSPPGPQPYAIYRKCFCLMPGYKKADLSFQIRGDDAIQVWLNSITNTIVTGQGGSFAGNPIQGPGPGLSPQFRTGVNCLYVLVEDTGSVVTGFNLAGTVSAYGLMPMASAGAGMSFAPCKCEGGPKAMVEDRTTIQAIVRFAEERRRRGAPTR